MKIERFTPGEIDIPPRLRARLDDAKVAEMMESINRIGLREPPTVRWAKDGDGDVLLLVTGRHRLEACKRLGHEMIECVVFEGDDDDARLWEIAENLHRAELTALEHDEHVAEWIKITTEKQAQVAPVSERGRIEGRGNRGGLNAAVRELGIERTAAQRAVKVDSLAPEAKEAAREVRLDDNRGALLKAAKEPTKEAQIAALRQQAAEKAAKRERDAEEARKAARETDKIVAERRLAAAVEFIAARMDVTEMHALGELLAGVADNLSRALMREAA